MSFLAPAFLAGALAIGFPIVFHLIRRTTRERLPFGSLMFLQPSPPRLTRRSRLEHIFLLVLRCLTLCLLTLGFARPFFKEAVGPEPAAGGKRLLVLLDTSASMRRATLWPDARAQAETVLRNTTPADQVSVYSFDRQVTPLLTFEEWNAASPGERVAQAMSKVAATSPGWSATYLGNALMRAAEILADAGGKQTTLSNQIVVITDLQEGSHLEPLQGYEWPKDVALSVEILKPKHTGNATLQLVTSSDDTSPGVKAAVRLRVSNGADAKREQFKVGWAAADGRSFAETPLEVYVPPGQSRVISLPVAGTSVNRCLLQGDDEDFDNTVFVIPPETQRLQVLYLGDEAESDSKRPLYFLKRGFQETRHQQVQVIAHGRSAPVAPTDIQSAALCIATDRLPETLAKTLHEEALSGKTILFAVKDTECAPTLATLLGADKVTVEEVRPDNNYAMLGEIDFGHPLFAPFADARFSDFTKIHFWKYRRLVPVEIPGARIVARFDKGDPALLEVPVGKGRVLVLTTGWQPDDSQLALSTKFVPLLYSMLEETGVPQPPVTEYKVGDTVPLPSRLTPGQTPEMVMTPGGSEIRLDPNETNFSRTLTPGVYTALSAGHVKELEFAVNLDATEGRTVSLPAEELERLGAPLSKPVSAQIAESQRKIRLQNAELENRQKLWRWLILATIFLLLAETYFAGRVARQVVRVPESAVT
jgi:hypothetical protein